MTKQPHRLWLVTCGGCAIALAASGATPGPSVDGDWGELLASRFSGECRQARQERGALAAQLGALPRISGCCWMELLHERDEIENAIHLLDVRSAAIATNFRRGALTAAGMAGLLMIGTIVALPIRHRRSELLKLRALRAQIAADLHDEIGSSMGSV